MWASLKLLLLTQPYVGALEPRLTLAKSSTYERVNPSGLISLFSMNRLAEGPIDAYTVDSRDKTNVLERDHILKRTTRLLFCRLDCREHFYTPEAYIPGFPVCFS